MYAKMSGSSIRDPFLDGYTGVKTIGVFERFTFGWYTGNCTENQTADFHDRTLLPLFFNQTGFRM